MTTISQQLRRAVAGYVGSREPQYAVARVCGMTPSTLSRFLAGTGGISLEAADRLAAYLQLGLTPAGDTPASARHALAAGWSRGQQLALSQEL